MQSSVHLQISFVPLRILIIILNNSGHLKVRNAQWMLCFVVTWLNRSGMSCCWTARRFQTRVKGGGTVNYSRIESEPRVMLHFFRGSRRMWGFNHSFQRGSRVKGLHTPRLEPRKFKAPRAGDPGVQTCNKREHKSTKKGNQIMHNLSILSKNIHMIM